MQECTNYLLAEPLPFIDTYPDSITAIGDNGSVTLPARVVELSKHHNARVLVNYTDATQVILFRYEPTIPNGVMIELYGDVSETVLDRECWVVQEKTSGEYQLPLTGDSAVVGCITSRPIPTTIGDGYENPELQFYSSFLRLMVYREGGRTEGPYELVPLDRPRQRPAYNHNEQAVPTRLYPGIPIRPDLTAVDIQQGTSDFNGEVGYTVEQLVGHTLMVERIHDATWSHYPLQLPGLTTRANPTEEMDFYLAIQDYLGNKAEFKSPVTDRAAVPLIATNDHTYIDYILQDPATRLAKFQERYPGTTLTYSGNRLTYVKGEGEDPTDYYEFPSVFVFEMPRSQYGVIRIRLTELVTRATKYTEVRVGAFSANGYIGGRGYYSTLRTNSYHDIYVTAGVDPFIVVRLDLTVTNGRNNTLAFPDKMVLEFEERIGDGSFQPMPLEQWSSQDIPPRNMFNRSLSLDNHMVTRITHVGYNPELDIHLWTHSD